MPPRIINHLKRSVVGYVALFLALGGAAYAGDPVTSADIVDGEVKSVDVANDNLSGVDVAPDSLRGADIVESSLSVKSMGCQSGKVLGFALIKGGSSIPAAYTSEPTALDKTNNCADRPIEVRRSGPGVYFVRFLGNPAALALVVANQDGASTTGSGDVDNLVTVGKITSGPDAGSFRVDVCDITPSFVHADGKFTILLP